MARIECHAARKGAPSTWVDVANITDKEVTQARAALDGYIVAGAQISDAVAQGFLHVAAMCPAANPSDLWQHVIYRHFIASESDSVWKRVSGYALERAFVLLYRPRLAPHHLRMRIVAQTEANGLLAKLGLHETKATGVDIFLEGQRGQDWLVFGAAHVKASVAERIKDDVPASVAFMGKRLLSIVLTMDSKSSPPPGDCINYGEFGARSLGVEKHRQKRDFFETLGHFDGLFSFNLRTPPSPKKTPSGKRIYTMSMHEKQPDQLVSFLIENWANHAKVKAP